MKIKIFKIEIVILILSITINGCKKSWLDAKADKSLAVPSTLKDFQALMDDFFTVNTNGVSLGEVASDGHYVSEAAWATAEDKPKNAYIWSHNSPYINVYDWYSEYQRIFQANLVIDGLKKINPSTTLDQQMWNNIEGQALFLRADALYWLSQVFAPTYNSTTSKDVLGIPLRLESDINLPTERSTVEETYRQIITDAMNAKNLLPTSNSFTRPKKVAAYALLARIYLSMQDYDIAGDYADSCLQLYNKLLDYNSLSANNDFIGGFQTNPEVIFHSTMETGGNSDFLTYNCLIDSTLYALFNDNDLRKTVFFGIDPSNSIFFKGNYYDNNTDLFCGLATDEMYLIRAEKFARKGNKDAAMNDLNTLLQKRWSNSVPFPNFTATNADDALNQILAERKKELLLRGLRWTDLRRLNLEDRFKQPITKVIGGQSYVLLPNSYKYTFPIPDDIISKTRIQQNSGW